MSALPWFLRRLCAVSGAEIGQLAAVAEDDHALSIERLVGKARKSVGDGRNDGAVSADGLVTGTYVHGLFADDRQRSRWMQLLGARTSDLAYESLVDDILDRFADHLEAHLDCERLLAISAR